MIGKTISHYPSFRDPVRRDKILKKLGEGSNGSLLHLKNKKKQKGATMKTQIISIIFIALILYSNQGISQIDSILCTGTI